MKALLVIDVQKEYMEKYEDNLLSKINQRIQHFIDNQELVIYVKNIRKLRSSTMSYEFADGLNVCSPYVIYKENASVFSVNELPNILSQNSVSKIEIIGIDGNSCVASSAAEGCKLGYEVILPCKYIGVQNSERFCKKKEDLAKIGVVILP